MHASSLGRSILSMRREHAQSPIDTVDTEIDTFQRQVSSLFHDLSSSDGFLSLSWIQKLLEAFCTCQDAFKRILTGNPAAFGRPPHDRLAADFFERSVKALDVCNAIRDGIQQVSDWQKHSEIVLTALNRLPVGEGQLRRAKKALTDLTIAMLDDKAAGAGVVSQRNRSFGRQPATPRGPHLRSLSWSVSRSWSAARQLQAIAVNLSPPRSSDGLAVAVYTMSSVLLFTMFALVAAVPCQDRGLQVHFTVPRTFPWAGTMMVLYDRILEESKKKDRRNSAGLLTEIHDLERCTRSLAELTDPTQSPLGTEKETELCRSVEELARVCGSFKDGLGPLERRVREVFHRIIRDRTDCAGQA